MTFDDRTDLTTGHPSVKNSKSLGALGMLVAKKTREGVMLYFAHNTDSFVRLFPSFVFISVYMYCWVDS